MKNFRFSVQALLSASACIFVAVVFNGCHKSQAGECDPSSTTQPGCAFASFNNDGACRCTACDKNWEPTQHKDGTTCAPPLDH